MVGAGRQAGFSVADSTSSFPQGPWALHALEGPGYIQPTDSPNVYWASWGF